MFSPYYRWARHGGRAADPENHCSLNVALYGAGSDRWAMTERGRGQIERSRSSFRIGPSRVHWDGNALVVDIEERGMPIPHRLRGRVRLHPGDGLCPFVTTLDAAGRHRWGPIAPCARVEVEMQEPGLRWSGNAYFDSNEGDEPIDKPFREWDWSRASMADGSTTVIYDVRPKTGDDRVIARRFNRDGSSTGFEAPPRQPLPRSKWLISRTMRNHAPTPARVLQSLEDTPFYARATLQARVLGEDVVAMHESLSVPRVVSWPVQLMLPWRMPRRA